MLTLKLGNYNWYFLVLVLSLLYSKSNVPRCNCGGAIIACKPLQIFLNHNVRISTNEYVSKRWPGQLCTATLWRCVSRSMFWGCLLHIIFQRKDSAIHPRGVCCDPVFELDHSVAWLDISARCMTAFWPRLHFNTVCMLPPQPTCTLRALDRLQTTLHWSYPESYSGKAVCYR